jgi:hypothetical protein
MVLLRVKCCLFNSVVEYFNCVADIHYLLISVT